MEETKKEEIDINKKPAKTKELQWNKAGEIYILADKNSNKNYTLDPIAFLVWLQCDGKTNIEQIVDVFSVDGNRDIVKAAITGILEKLTGSGLLKWV
jgi:hypothetical protein